MNIQQIKYIVALDRLRNFARAAEACDVSQPTLMELERINEIVSEENGMLDAAIPHRQTA